jgi:hypothetical protein
MRIEVLYWEGCPSHPEAIALLDDVLAQLGVAADVTLTEVMTDSDAVARRFPGSPTIRIDGRDVDPAGADAPPSLTCRIYNVPGGVSPIPTREQLEHAVLIAATKEEELDDAPDSHARQRARAR